MFGKDAHANEQVSEDEDWGPANKRRREKESDAASTLITLYEGEKKLPNVETMGAKQKIPPDPQTKRPFSRIPLDAVEVIGILCLHRNHFYSGLGLIISNHASNTSNFTLIFSYVLYQKLRQAFGENELPSKDVRENLAKQLGLDYEKVKTLSYQLNGSLDGSLEDDS